MIGRVSRTTAEKRIDSFGVTISCPEAIRFFSSSACARRPPSRLANSSPPGNRKRTRIVPLRRTRLPEHRGCAQRRADLLLRAQRKR